MPGFDYELRCAEATTDQGLDPVIDTLKAAGLDVRAEQTGGFTMVACVYEAARPHHYVGITEELHDQPGYLVVGYGPDGWQEGETLSETATLDDLEGLARGWLWPFDWPPTEAGPNPFCTNRSSAGDACGACAGCQAEVAHLHRLERERVRARAELEALDAEPVETYAGASNAELADALEGFADGQDDDLGAMVTEAARRLRPDPAVAELARLRRAGMVRLPTLTAGELRAALPADDMFPVTVGTPDGGWLNVDGVTDPAETDEPSAIIMTRDDFDTRQW